MKVRKSTIQNYAISVTGVGFSRGVAFFNSILIARLLGPAKFGEFALFQIVMILTYQITTAFDTTYVRYAKATTESQKKQAFLRSSLLVKVCYVGFVLVFSFPLSSMLAQLVFHKPGIAMSLFLAFLCGCFLSFLQTVAAFFQAKEKFVHFALVNSTFSVSVFMLIMSLFTTYGAFDLDILLHLISLIAILIGSASLTFLLKQSGNPLHPDNKAFGKTFSLGKWIFGVAVVFFIFQRIDTLFLTRIMQLKSIGIYFAATQVVMFVGLISGPLSSVFLPMASTALESRDSMKLYWKESMVAIMAVNAFITLLIILAPFILKTAYGEQYLVGTLPLRILLVGWIFWITYQPFSYLFYTLEDSRMRFFMESLKLCTAVILLAILVPLYGLTGAATSVALSFLSNTIISSFVLWKKIKISFQGLLKAHGEC